MTECFDIAFHVGAHKTASTHLQLVLTGLEGRLAEADVRLVTPQQTRNRGISFAEGVGYPEGDGPAHLPPCARLILSEENALGRVIDGDGLVLDDPFYPSAVKSIAGHVARLAPHPVHLFLAVRAPHDFLTSMYSQALMRGKVTGWSDYEAQVSFRSIDWPGLVARLMDGTGCASLTLWRMEDYNTLLPHLVQRLAGQAMALPDPLPRPAHVGLSARAVAACHAWAQEGLEGPLGAVAREDYPVSDRNPAFAPWTAQARRTSGRIYREMLDKIVAIPGVTVLTP